MQAGSWPLLLWVESIIATFTEFLGAAGLAALNTALGVAMHQLHIHLYTWI